MDSKVKSDNLAINLRYILFKNYLFYFTLCLKQNHRIIQNVYYIAFLEDVKFL